MKRGLLSLIFAFTILLSFSQNPIFRSSVAELKLIDNDHVASLFTNRAILSYNSNTGELRCTLNIQVLTDQRYGMSDNMMDLEAIDPSDSSVFYFSAVVPTGTFKASGTPMDAADLPLPGYIVYQGIQQAVIAEYSYGSSMNQNNQKIYLNLFFKGANDPANLIRFPQLSFIPTEFQVDVIDGLVNLVNW